MQPNAPKHVEEVIIDWCTTNGFGSDPVTISTFTELAKKLLDSIGERLSGDGLAHRQECEASQENDVTVAGVTVNLSGSNYTLTPHVKGELSKPDNYTGGKTTGRAASDKFFLDLSGEWRETFYDGDWWVIGHQMMYPARDLDHAQRLRAELSLKG
ncbi:MAG: hypothetical protein ABIN58_02385 [candidate division WOR-3 bacterium]